MHLATIRSMVHPKLSSSIIVDEGFYELEVHIDMTQAEGDPPGYVRHVLAQHLAQCVHTTGLPLGERCWTIEFTTATQTLFNYPEGVVL